MTEYTCSDWLDMINRSGYLKRVPANQLPYLEDWGDKVTISGYGKLKTSATTTSLDADLSTPPCSKHIDLPGIIARLIFPPYKSRIEVQSWPCPRTFAMRDWCVLCCIVGGVLDAAHVR